MEVRKAYRAIGVYFEETLDLAWSDIENLPKKVV
jgi:hypothetical protein